MDWKGLVQFALTGGRDLEQCAILLVRVSMVVYGVFETSPGSVFTASSVSAQPATT
jgi:hypothetical protein